MQIVIDIPEGAYEEICRARFPLQDGYRLVSWIKDGTPLQKGHGRLINADNLPLNAIDDANYGSNYIKIAPTIIEADKAESEVENAE